MRYFLLLFSVIIIAFVSCDDSEQYFESLNEFPELSIRKFGSLSFRDTIQDSVKFVNNYSIEYKIIDDENIFPEFEFILGSGDLFHIPDSHKIDIILDTIGSHIILLKVSDSFKQEAFAVLNLFSFKNLKPVCLFNIEKNTVYSNLEIIIDASQSYDLDHNFGGKIINYKYEIQGANNQITSLNQINHIFLEIGTYRITVSVQDNDSVWSLPVTENFLISEQY